jgi:hypothetical protein
MGFSSFTLNIQSLNKISLNMLRKNLGKLDKKENFFTNLCKKKSRYFKAQIELTGTCRVQMSSPQFAVSAKVLISVRTSLAAQNPAASCSSKKVQHQNLSIFQAASAIIIVNKVFLVQTDDDGTSSTLRRHPRRSTIAATLNPAKVRAR